MDTKKFSEVERFGNVGAGIDLLGYHSETNKVGRVPLMSLTGKAPIAGVRWALDQSSPEGEPYGDLDTIRNLASVLGLGGYLVQNDHTRQKLHAADHFKLANGSPAALDGTMGHYQWGWGVPFYYATWKDETYLYEAVSTSPIAGHWNYKIPIASISASGAAALDRTNNILVSYCNRTTQYRGGNNQSAYDEEWNTQLGKPVVSVAGDSMQRYAEKNGGRWGSSMYMVNYIIAALMRIVFHNRNSQAAFNSALTANGVHQGGLGEGVPYKGSDFGSQFATCDIDALSDKGDALGVFSVVLTKGDNTQYTIPNIPVFYGLKNPFHYVWTIQHGVLLKYNADTSADVYVKKVWDNNPVPIDTLTGMEKIGTIPAAPAGWTHTKEMNTAFLCNFPLQLNGSTSTYYCDGYYPAGITSGFRALLALGASLNAFFAGSCCLYGSYVPSVASVDIGGSLCEADEDWDTTPFWVG